MKVLNAITPGEWKFGKRRDGSLWLSLGDPKKGHHYQGDLCASQADAALIIAAPDLLAALKAICDCDGSREGLMAAARAAIAKAEGRAA